jgi:hypothetical protein
MKDDVQPTTLSGNVFRDVGFSPEESAHLLVRADLLIQTAEDTGIPGSETG